MFTKMFSFLVILYCFVIGSCPHMKLLSVNNASIYWNNAELYAGQYIGGPDFDGSPVPDLVLYTSKDSTYTDKNPILDYNEIIKCYQFTDICEKYLQGCERYDHICFVTFPNKKYIIVISDYQTNCHASHLATSNSISCDIKTTSFLFDSSLHFIIRKNLEGVKNPFNYSKKFTKTYEGLNTAIWTKVEFDITETYRFSINEANNTFDVKYLQQLTKAEIRSTKLNNFHRVMNSQRKDLNLLGKKVNTVNNKNISIKF